MFNMLHQCRKMLGNIWWWWCWISLIVMVEAATLVQFADATQMFSIRWNTTNPIFRIDNTDHIIDVNTNNQQFEYDQVNIICPVYSKDTKDDDAEKYIIYNVSKEEYETCRITNPTPRVIAICDKPHTNLYFTITFRSFTPQPGGLEFRAGTDYYFISTSSQDELYRLVGGRCATHHMKVVFKVCCDPASQPAGDQGKPPKINGPSNHPGSTTTTTTTTKSTTSSTTPKTTTSTSTTTTFSTTSYKTPSRNYDDQYDKKKNKKTDKNELDRSENEVVKNQLKTTNRCSTITPTKLLVNVMLTLALMHKLAQQYL